MQKDSYSLGQFLPTLGFKNSAWKSLLLMLSLLIHLGKMTLLCNCLELLIKINEDLAVFALACFFDQTSLIWTGLTPRLDRLDALPRSQQ